MQENSQVQVRQRSNKHSASGRKLTGSKASNAIFSYGGALVAARALPVLAIFVASLRLEGADFGAAAVVIGAITTSALIADSGTDAGATYLSSRADDERHFDRTIGALVLVKVLLASVALISLMLTQIDLLGVTEG